LRLQHTLFECQVGNVDGFSDHICAMTIRIIFLIADYFRL
jgi:hypothetical protein